MNFTITGYSTALFATWYFIEELGVLFDAGDGVTAGLTQKTGKIRQVAISHADRDHITGLLQLNQLNARPGLPKIYYPKDSASFPALRDFSNRFDAQVARTDWQGIGPEDRIAIGKTAQLRPIVNGHVSAAGEKVRSLSYIIEEIRRKLRPEYAGLKGHDIGRLRRELGDAAVMDEVRTPILAYSGDTPVEDLQRYAGVRILIHEATFLEKTDVAHFNDKPNKHSALPDVIGMAAGLRLECLILGHFSCRYTSEEIDAAVKAQCAVRQVSFPVFVVYPARIHTDILAGKPCWAPVQRWPGSEPCQH